MLGGYPPPKKLHTEVTGTGLGHAFERFLSELVDSPCSLDTHRDLCENSLTMLPEGIFRELTLLEEL